MVAAPAAASSSCCTHWVEGAATNCVDPTPHPVSGRRGRNYIDIVDINIDPNNDNNNETSIIVNICVNNIDPNIIVTNNIDIYSDPINTINIIGSNTKNNYP